MLNWTVDQSGMTDDRFQRQYRMPRALFYGLLRRIEPDLFRGQKQYRLAKVLRAHDVPTYGTFCDVEFLEAHDRRQGQNGFYLPLGSMRSVATGQVLTDVPEEGEYVYARLEAGGGRGANSSRGGIISPLWKLSCTLRYLAGGSYLDITRMHAISDRTFYGIVEQTIVAILVHGSESMKYSFGLDDLIRKENRFARKSGGAFRGCIGALDGLCVQIERPHPSDCGNNPSGYYTRKGFYSLNIQVSVIVIVQIINQATLTPHSLAGYAPPPLPRPSQTQTAGWISSPPMRELKVSGMVTS